MAESHASLRDDFEVSCRELDIMVEIASKQSGTYGSRMTGGGFGGCTVSLVDAASVPEFERRVRHEFFEVINITPQVYICKPSEGAREIIVASPHGAE